ncbi:hypothetical protein NDU88_000193 [Pleurodeles waltl]|uniref:Uncharacterized protein n=1 Tax=Pleurodeles waltl TaxID=8319 RepID=A0AAV7KLN1_PLEWA|nr:hypothetical protein NDU88_000193 [Pleurodeles waltl]
MQDLSPSVSASTHVPTIHHECGPQQCCRQLKMRNPRDPKQRFRPSSHRCVLWVQLPGVTRRWLPSSEASLFSTAKDTLCPTSGPQCGPPCRRTRPRLQGPDMSPICGQEPCGVVLCRLGSLALDDRAL